MTVIRQKCKTRWDRWLILNLVADVTSHMTVINIKCDRKRSCQNSSFLAVGVNLSKTFKKNYRPRVEYFGLRKSCCDLFVCCYVMLCCVLGGWGAGGGRGGDYKLCQICKWNMTHMWQTRYNLCTNYYACLFKCMLHILQYTYFYKHHDAQAFHPLYQDFYRHHLPSSSQVSTSTIKIMIKNQYLGELTTRNGWAP